MRIPSENTLGPFDRDLWIKRRNRAAKTLADADFLLAETTERIVERLKDVKRGFPAAAIVGAWDGSMANALNGRFGIEALTQIDAAPDMARLAETSAPFAKTVVGDEESLPLETGSLDPVSYTHLTLPTKA